MNRKIFSFLLTLILLSFVVEVFAVEVTLFGPKQYLRGNGSPVTVTDSFPGVSGGATLLITNGDANGKNRVSSGTIMVNGITVVTPDKFNQQVSSFMVPISVLEQNTIAVNLASKPGSFITVTIKEEIQAEAAGIVGPEGGTLQGDDGCSIQIPAGAIETPTLFSLRSIGVESLPAPLPEGLIFLGGLEILPSGTSFNIPITVRIKLSDPSIPEGTFIPILFYEPSSGYQFEGWDGVVDDQGFVVSDKIAHLSIIGLWTDPLLHQGKYKADMIQVLTNFLNNINNHLCSYEKGFFSIGDINKLKNFINRYDLAIAVNPTIVGDAAAKYISGIIPLPPPLSWTYKTIVLKDEPKNLNYLTDGSTLYHELMHYVFDINQNRFETTGFPFEASHDEDMAYYMEQAWPEAGFLKNAEQYLIQTPCNYQSYVKNLNYFVDDMKKYLDGSQRGCFTSGYGCDDDPIPVSVLGLMKELLGFDVDPDKIYQHYEAGDCGACTPPVPGTWLSFVEGNPGVPGDGKIISSAGGNYDFTFTLSSPLSLGDTTDGLTITLFPPSDIIQEPQWIDVYIVVHKDPYCLWEIWGALGSSRGTTVYNGVKGYFVNIPQETIARQVTWANQYLPSCNLTAEDFYLSDVWFDSATILTLDAAIILPGQNAVP